MKRIALGLIVCFVVAGLWQHDKIAHFLKNDIHISWLSFTTADSAAARVKYMQKGTGPVKIAFIPPYDQAYVSNAQDFQSTVNGAAIAAELAGEKRGAGRRIELIVPAAGPGYESGIRAISSLGMDPGVLAVILPYSYSTQLESEVMAEYMGLMIFHAGHLFASREQESELAFSNIYPFEQFSEKIALYAEKRGVRSVLMLTQKGRHGEDIAKNQDFWFSKKSIPVPAAFLYEQHMINGPMLEELSKNVGIFGTDAVYWGSALNANLLSLGDSMRQLTPNGPMEHFMFLSIVPDNNETLAKRLQLIESSTLDPVIAFPVITNMQQKTEFDKLYYEKYKAKANHSAYYGYDTFMLLAECILKDNNVSPQAIAQILTRKSYAGILATYQFNEDGVLDDQVAVNIKLGKVKNGELVAIDIEKINPADSQRDKPKGNQSLLKATK